MAKPDYKFQKRQKELARKKTKEEKLQRKQERNPSHAGEDADGSKDGEEVS